MAAPAAPVDAARGAVVIVARCHDGSVRVFAWTTGGTGPDNTWARLSNAVDANLARSQFDLPPGALIRLQAAQIESVDIAEETAVRP